MRWIEESFDALRAEKLARELSISPLLARLLVQRGMTEPAAAHSNGPAVEGELLFRLKKCGDCHAIAGTGARGESGPDLTHVATRRFLGGVISPNTPENLAFWSALPQSIKPGNRMPDQPLSAAERTSIAAYLESLR